ncbi:hypothetical protein AAW51_4014 [Caldimonas brevitalea]|uniref:Uncharacterized protein n=2 Tax=Caldimonas brevitalea TaxID=413882 RepID=A0A0G3BW00_9BURK|nr:hypothetical protein AAW51_4014 [Caldimonas brevitalea]
MIACGPHHHMTGVVASQPASHGTHDEAGGHAEHGHGPHAHGPSTSAEDTPDAQGTTAADAQPDAEAHKPVASKCSVCASCCSAAALPASAIVIDPSPVAHSVRPSVESHPAVFMTDGPERPPRTFLA